MQDNNTKQVVNTKMELPDSRKPVITSRNLNVFAMFASGMKAKDIASELGLDVRTVEWHIAKCKKELESIDDKDLQNGVKGLYPLGWESLKHNLEAKNVKTTIQYLKGIKAFVSHQTSDNRTLNLHIHKIADKLRLNKVQAKVVEDDSDGGEGG